LHDSSEYGFEKLLNFDKSLYERKAEEGYVHSIILNKNYVGIEEELDN